LRLSVILSVCQSVCKHSYGRNFDNDKSLENVLSGSTKTFIFTILLSLKALFEKFPKISA